MNAPIPVRPGTVVLVAVTVAALAYAGLRWWTDGGRAFPHPSWFELVAVLLIGGTLLVLGNRVRRMARGIDGARVTALTAARTFVLAQACAVVGGALAGAHVAGVAALWQEAVEAGARGGIVRQAVLAVSAAALAVAGLVVQRWCRHDDDPRADRDDPGPLDDERATPA